MFSCCRNLCQNLQRPIIAYYVEIEPMRNKGSQSCMNKRGWLSLLREIVRADILLSETVKVDNKTDKKTESELKFLLTGTYIMPTQTAKDDQMLLTLFGDHSLVKKYQNQKNPGKKMEMIWKTIFFQVKNPNGRHRFCTDKIL